LRHQIKSHPAPPLAMRDAASLSTSTSRLRTHVRMLFIYLFSSCEERPSVYCPPDDVVISVGCAAWAPRSATSTLDRESQMALESSVVQVFHRSELLPLCVRPCCRKSMMLHMLTRCACRVSRTTAQFLSYSH